MMKKIYNLFFGLGLIAIAAGCSKNDGIVPEKAAELTFKERYPDATNVQWSQKSNYYVAEFRLSQQEKEAWFDVSGQWQLTETDLVYNDLTAEVKASFEASEYADWEIDDIDFVERQDQEAFYVVEIEKNEAEYDLYFLTDGTLIKAVPDSDDDNDYLPAELHASVAQYLETKYPGYKLIDTDTDDGRIEVDFIFESLLREAVFSSDGEWIKTTTDIRIDALPDNIKAILAASAYSTYRIDDAEYVETSTGVYYELELESGDNDVDVRVFADGTLEVIPD